MRRRKTTYQRYYYKEDASTNPDHATFEQSLDVYKPVMVRGEEEEVLRDDDDDETSKFLGNNRDDDDGDTPTPPPSPLVVMVVGSGWMGHRSFIYSGTSWWNSSCPRTMAQLGHVSVCIRHRGAFPTYLFTIPHEYRWMVLGIVTSILGGLAQLYGLVTTLMVAVVCLTFVRLWHYAGYGAADLDDMMNDVADALAWIERHRDTNLLLLLPPGKTKEEDEKNDDDDDTKQHEQEGERTTRHRRRRRRRPPPPIIFGGYSSGGHVAAMVIQRSKELFSPRKKLLPHTSLDEFLGEGGGILLISGCLSVRPLRTETEMETTMIQAKKPPPPTWMTDFVLYTVFGPQQEPSQPLGNDDDNDGDGLGKRTEGGPSAMLPQPSDAIHEHPPTIPHLFVGCRNEIPLGIDWLDVFFTSSQYCDALQRLYGSTHSTYRELKTTDHWFILSSDELFHVLGEGIPQLQSVSVSLRRSSAKNGKMTRGTSTTTMTSTTKKNLTEVDGDGKSGRNDTTVGLGETGTDGSGGTTPTSSSPGHDLASSFAVNDPPRQD